MNKMANTVLTASVIAREALMQLENSCTMANLVHRGLEQEYQTKVNGYKKGQTISISAPMYARTHAGPDTSSVDAYERSITITVDQHRTVDFSVTMLDLTQKIADFSRLFVQPAMVAMADYVDNYMMALYKYVPAQVGTPGSSLTSMAAFDLANARLDYESVPSNQRYCVMSPGTHAAMAGYMRGLAVNPTVESAIRGKLGDMWGGFDSIFKSQNCPRHTPGTWAGDTVTKDGDSTENEFDLDLADATGDNAIAAGDIFTIADCYAVNKINGNIRSDLRQFVSPTAVTFSSGAGTVDYPLGTEQHGLIGASTTTAALQPYQTVGTLPANTKALTIAGTASTPHNVDLAFHRNAFALACVPIEKQRGKAFDQSVASHNGLSVMVTLGDTFSNLSSQIRFDILFGAKVLNPLLACRIAS